MAGIRSLILGKLKMEYKIHGKPFAYTGEECGLYKDRGDAMHSYDYSEMDQSLLIRAINNMPKDEAIVAIRQLRDIALKQSKLNSAPQNEGYPILKRNPEPRKIDEVREYIDNTVKFSEDILNILGDK